MSAANNKVPGYPLEIFDFVSGSGSYIMLAKQVYHTACRISYRVSDISFMQGFEFIRKNGKNIFFVVHRQKKKDTRERVFSFLRK